MSRQLVCEDLGLSPRRAPAGHHAYSCRPAGRCWFRGLFWCSQPLSLSPKSRQVTVPFSSQRNAAPGAFTVCFSTTSVCVCAQSCVSIWTHPSILCLGAPLFMFLPQGSVCLSPVPLPAPGHDLDVGSLLQPVVRPLLPFLQMSSQVRCACSVASLPTYS